MRWLILAALLSLSCATTAATLPRVDPTPPPVPRAVWARRVAALEVTVACQVADGMKLTRGSAVAVGERSALTAYHVVDGCAEPLVMLTRPGDTNWAVLAEVEVVAMRADVARLRVLGSLPGPFPDAAAPPAPGDGICIVAALPELRVSCGVIDESDALPGDVVHSAFTRPGNSGSGVYDFSGRLVGVVTHYRVVYGVPSGGKFSSILPDRGWLL